MPRVACLQFRDLRKILLRAEAKVNEEKAAALAKKRSDAARKAADEKAALAAQAAEQAAEQTTEASAETASEAPEEVQA